MSTAHSLFSDSPQRGSSYSHWRRCNNFLYLDKFYLFMGRGSWFFSFLPPSTLQHIVIAEEITDFSSIQIVDLQLSSFNLATDRQKIVISDNCVHGCIAPITLRIKKKDVQLPQIKTSFWNAPLIVRARVNRFVHCGARYFPTLRAGS